MLPIPRRYAHFLFGVIQSGLTSAIAAAMASAGLPAEASFFGHWLRSWLLSWILILPIVLFAAPFIRRLTTVLTRPEPSHS